MQNLISGKSWDFFSSSAKRQRLLDAALDKVTIPTKAKKLKDACRTRWVQRVDSYAVFEELLPAVHTTLQAMVYPRQFEELGIDWNWDSETTTKANGYLFQLESSSFLICFKILLKVLCYLREITIKLQMEAIDVAYAYKQVCVVVTTLKDMRSKSTDGFKTLFASTISWARIFMESNFNCANQELFAVKHTGATLTYRVLRIFFVSLSTMNFCLMSLLNFKRDFSITKHKMLQLGFCISYHMNVSS